MPKRNDLSSLKVGTQRPILPSSASAPKRTRATSAPGDARHSRRSPKPKVGRPPKPKADKRDYKITLSLTQAQGATVKDKAGLATEAAVIYDHLVKTGFFV